MEILYDNANKNLLKGLFSGNNALVKSFLASLKRNEKGKDFLSN